jgi:biotin operon repressor
VNQSLGDRLAEVARVLDALAARESVDPQELSAIRARLAAIERESGGLTGRRAAGQGARGRILAYLLERVGQPVSGEELREVSGIQEWARRVRELRVEIGYPIEERDGCYELLSEVPDEEAAARWRQANRIRRQPGDARDRIAELFRANVGKVVTLEELHYVARIKEVPRRIRELRDEYGMRISSRHVRPDLRPDEYLLETLEVLPANERQVKPAVWEAVLARDGHRCVRCGTRPGHQGRWLEVDHIIEKLDGGTDTVENLQTLCNVCHSAKTAEYQARRRDKDR